MENPIDKDMSIKRNKNSFVLLFSVHVIAYRVFTVKFHGNLMHMNCAESFPS